jgi:hypothetical protein
MPEAPKARSAPRGGLRVRIGVVLGLLLCKLFEADN